MIKISAPVSFPVAVLLGVVTGFLFGTALEKSKVALPYVLRAQMDFSNNMMLKFFLAAILVSHVSILVAETFFGAKRTARSARALGGPFEHYLGGYGGNILGGIILGVGIMLAGACPGAVLVQLGAGAQYAAITLVGAYFGVITYAASERLLKSLTHESKHPHAAESPAVRIDHHFGWREEAMAALVTVILVSALAFLEYVSPTHKEMAQLGLAMPKRLLGLEFTSEVWHPILAGALVGLFQLPSLVFMQSTLGTSASYCTQWAFFLQKVSNDATTRLPYLLKFQGGTNNFWQVALAAGMILGGALSSYASNVHPLLASWSPITSLVGGFLALFGARLAGGCTSGHGVSGIATLSVSSVITIAAAFAGAIGTRMITGL